MKRVRSLELGVLSSRSQGYDPEIRVAGHETRTR
jgi:hypothetical protein